MVELFAVVLVGLSTCIECGIAKDSAEGIVVCDLLQCAVLIDHRAVVAQVIF